MYPFVRQLKEMVRAQFMGPMDLLDTHVTHTLCWPWDLDGWGELNNGRSLTLYDLGRFPVFIRTGIGRAALRNRWGLTMAGAAAMWRRRVRIFDRIDIHSRLIGWDHRFFYIEQCMWLPGKRTAASSVIYRSACTDRNGIVAPQRVLDFLGHDRPSPPLPGWVGKWTEAEAQRPWPPFCAEDG